MTPQKQKIATKLVTELGTVCLRYKSRLTLEEVAGLVQGFADNVVAESMPQPEGMEEGFAADLMELIGKYPLAPAAMIGGLVCAICSVLQAVRSNGEDVTELASAAIGAIGDAAGIAATVAVVPIVPPRSASNNTVN